MDRAASRTLHTVELTATAESRERLDYHPEQLAAAPAALAADHESSGQAARTALRRQTELVPQRHGTNQLRKRGAPSASCSTAAGGPCCARGE